MPYAEAPQLNTLPQMQPQAQQPFNVPDFISSARQQGISDEQTLQFLQQKGLIQPQENGAQLKDTGSFIGNAINSAGNFLGGIGNAIMHPVDTVTNVGKGLIGAGENLASGLATGNFSAAETKGGDQFTQVADNIGNFINQRYGSLDAAKKTAYQDPIGFLADASTLLGAGGAGLSKAGEVSKVGELSKAGEFLNSASDVTNPIVQGGKVVNKIGKPIGEFLGSQVANALGTSTGAGGSSIKGVFNAAKENGFNNQAIQAARGGISEDQVIRSATDAFDQIKQNRNTAYQQQLGKIKGLDSELDYMPAVEEFRKQLKDNGITVKNGELQFENARGFQNPAEQAVLQNAYDRIERWGDLPKNNTLFGLDTLKQQLGDFIEQSSGKAKPVLTSTKKILSGVLEQNPEYKNLVQPYETTSNLIDDLRSTLSLNSKNPETVLKKLTSALKQDNEFRQSFIDELNKVSDQDIIGQLSGINMSKLHNPSKINTYLEAGVFFAHPSLWPAFIAASPRVVAEFANALGFSAKQITKGLELIKKLKVNSGSLNSLQRLNASQNLSPSQPDQRSRKEPSKILIKKIGT